MTSTDFERMAKEKVMDIMAERHGEDVDDANLQVVWMTHCLGHKKCLLWSPEMGCHYAEVTYNVEKDEMYVDIYKKISNSVVRFVEPSEM